MSHLPEKMLRKRATLTDIREMLTENTGSLQWVAEVEGAVVAAILLIRCKSDGTGGSDANVDFNFIGLHPGLEERAEIFYAIANFALQCLLVAGDVRELRQGNLRIDLGFGDAGPEAVLAKFQTVAHTGKSERLHYNKDIFSQSKFGRGFSNPFGGLGHREVVFGSWISLDGLVSWVTSQVSAGLLTFPSKGVSAESYNGGRDITKGPLALGGPLDRRRSKLSLIVEEARRLTSTADFNDAGKYRYLLCVI